MNFDKVGEAAAFGFTPPFLFGMPKFDFVACLTMIIVLLITAVESTGSTIATGEIVGKRVKASDIGNVLRADGVATTIGGIFNSFPYTAFSENVGLVRLTGVKSRWVVAAAGVIMIILGFLPKVAAVVASIPNPVLGGAALTLFATVAVVGIQTLGKVDFTDHRNLIIVTTSLALALWVTSYPDIAKAMPTGLNLIFGSGISIGAVAAILLNIVFFHTGSRGPRVAGGGSITLDEVNTMTKERFTEVFGHVVQDVPWAVERALSSGRSPTPRHCARRSRTRCSPDRPTSSSNCSTHSTIWAPRTRPVMRSPSTTSHCPTSTTTDHNDVVELAGAYREHFGFPLIICARETEHFDRVLKNGWSRMDNSPAAEKAFALIEVAKIANYRFADLVADANPIAAARFSRLNELQ